MPDKRKPPKWRAPFAEWVRQSVCAWRAHGFHNEAAKLRAIADDPTILRMLGQLLGDKGPAVKVEAFRPSFPFYSRAILKRSWQFTVEAEIRLRTMVNVSPTDEYLRLGAAVQLLILVAAAAHRDMRLERGGPLNLDAPGDVVGFKRYNGKPASRGRALAITGRVIGAMFALYGKPFRKIARTLVKSAVGIELTLDEISALIERHFYS
jgi:hypothetical protein